MSIGLSVFACVSVSVFAGVCVQCVWGDFYVCINVWAHYFLPTGPCRYHFGAASETRLMEAMLATRPGASWGLNRRNGNVQSPPDSGKNI